MCPEQENEETIFYAALDIESPAERKAYLKKACGTDKELLARIEALLDVQRTEHSILETVAPHLGITLEEETLSEGPGTVIGRYKLLERIGEGGMAVVYMAEQQEPIRRKVALKIIKLGMDTKAVIARFEAERQALAMMDHLNIAKVLDAGATDTGRPYFVMELVTGVSITEYCDKNNLSTKDRLGLFIQICNAVQHAHEKGVVHRDIKPSNVMVANNDGRPVPKVIDFGIAKATNQRLTEKTLFTRYAHIIGTPAYMSPEQAELSDLGIDSRSDIYSLGVLLYELLTGTTPFSEEELRKAGYLEMQRIIREEEPAKPSTKLSTLGQTLADIARRRGCTPDLLTKTVRGDLDWIVMKALEKERARRYEGVSGFALDIERHVKHRPVSARAPSVSYRARKFLRRNRLQTVAGLAAGLVACIIIVISIWSRHQVRLAEAEGVRQVNVLDEARRLITKGNISEARKVLRPILESRHVGLEARNLFVETLIAGRESDEILKGAEAIMDRHYRERVQYYTEQIKLNPEDPNNYLRRAQQYHYLDQERDVQADMIRYASLLGQGQVPVLLFGASKKFNPVRHVRYCYQFVLSAASRKSGIVEISIAFGQKGSVSMKSFDIPMLVMTLLGFGFLSGFDEPVVLADFTFGEPVNIELLISAKDNIIECFSRDGLEMYISSYNRAGGYGDWDLNVLRRTSKDADWGPIENLGPVVNSSREDGLSSISADGLSLYFNSNRAGGHGGFDIYMTTRATSNDPWGPPVNLDSNISGSANDCAPWISGNGLELYFVSYRSGGFGRADIYVARRKTTNDSWGAAMNLGGVVNSVYSEHYVSLSPDGLLLFFSDHHLANPVRPGGYGGPDTWMTRRATIDDDSWGIPVNLGPQINSSLADIVARMSPDGRTLYFSTGTPGGNWDYYQAPIVPVADFDGDGKVDGKELLDIVEHFGQNESLYDIGPSPLGDGVVDVNDLIVLADYIGNEEADPTLRACWAFEEGVGSVAMDWVGGYDALIAGNVVWESEGKIGGALAFDGTQNLARTMSPVLNPGTGIFSAIAWIKGGAPNGVIMSQMLGADWLYVDPSGMLATDLKASGANGKTLTSDAFVLDDQWHRVAVVWDGTNRSLLMDADEVARDTQPGLAGSSGNLQMGCDKNATPATLWSGLIDDVRIYNRVVRP